MYLKISLTDPSRVKLPQVGLKKWPLRIISSDINYRLTIANIFNDVNEFFGFQRSSPDKQPLETRLANVIMGILRVDAAAVQDRICAADSQFNGQPHFFRSLGTAGFARADGKKRFVSNNNLFI